MLLTKNNSEVPVEQQLKDLIYVKHQDKFYNNLDALLEVSHREVTDFISCKNQIIVQCVSKRNGLKSYITIDFYGVRNYLFGDDTFNDLKRECQTITILLGDLQ